jgi:hypothetical protein
VVNTHGGNDTVDYWLTGPLQLNRSVVVDLGRRNDTFTAHLSGQTLMAGASLWLGAYGHGGNDRLVLDAQGFNTDVGSRLFVDYAGGRGKDAVALNFSKGNLYLGQDFLSGVA